MNYIPPPHPSFPSPLPQQILLNNSQNKNPQNTSTNSQFSPSIKPLKNNQIKSMTTLPSYNYLSNSSSRINNSNNLTQLSHHSPQLYYQINPYHYHNNHNNHHNSNKISEANRKQGHIYKIPVQSSPPKYKNKQKQQNSQPIPQTKQQKTNLYLHEQLIRLQNQNKQLKQKLLTNQFKQRQYIDKIYILQIKYLQLQSSIHKKSINKQQCLFISVVKKTFQDCFQIYHLKQIWKKIKSILKDWMELTSNNNNIPQISSINNIKTHHQNSTQPTSLSFGTPLQNYLIKNKNQKKQNIIDTQQQQKQIKIKIVQENSTSPPKSTSKKTKIKITEIQPSEESYSP